MLQMHLRGAAMVGRGVDREKARALVSGRTIATSSTRDTAIEGARVCLEYSVLTPVETMRHLVNATGLRSEQSIAGNSAQNYQ